MGRGSNSGGECMHAWRIPRGTVCMVGNSGRFGSDLLNSRGRHEVGDYEVGVIDYKSIRFNIPRRG